MMEISQKLIAEAAARLTEEHYQGLAYLDLTTEEASVFTNGIEEFPPREQAACRLEEWARSFTESALCHPDDRERLARFLSRNRLLAALQGRKSPTEQIVFRRKYDPSDRVYSIVSLELLPVHPENGHTAVLVFEQNQTEESRKSRNCLQEGNVLPAAISGKRTVLVVEDNWINLEMLTEILSEEYTVLQAENGKEGLELLQEKLSEIAVVILDVQMPVMNGYEFLEIVKSDPLLAEIPVVVATGNDNLEEEQKCLSLGANDFVAKPYNARIILSRVASIIRLKESVATMSLLQLDDRTGLYTLQAFFHYARQTLSRSPEKQFSLIIIDIERFKTIYEIYGEKFASKLVRQCADVLRNYTAASDLYGRFGGAKFLLLREESTEEASAAWMNHTFTALQEAAGGKNIAFRAGVYRITDPTLPVSTMCEHAYTALTGLEQGIDNRFAVYDRRHAEREARLAKLEMDMREACDSGQFSVFYQPKHDTATGALVGAEALIRWVHPELGFLSPGEFIPLFERNGFITRADTYVWARTCLNQRKWMDMGLRVVPISVNASRRDFSLDHFLDHCLEPIRDCGLRPGLLHLEVTETLFSDNMEEISGILQSCRDAGIEIELDDFGSGYSSLTTLAMLPLDTIKLDMSFMRKIQDERNVRVLAACVHLAKSLHLQTVCEGVETEPQLELLKELGCDRIQGYYFSKPLPEKEFEAYLKKYTEEG